MKFKYDYGLVRWISRHAWHRECALCACDGWIKIRQHSSIPFITLCCRCQIKPDVSWIGPFIAGRDLLWWAQSRKTRRDTTRRSLKRDDDRLTLSCIFTAFNIAAQHPQLRRLHPPASSGIMSFVRSFLNYTQRQNLTIRHDFGGSRLTLLRVSAFVSVFMHVVLCIHYCFEAHFIYFLLFGVSRPAKSLN